MKKITVALLLVHVCLFGMSQTLTVQDKTTKEPIEGAVIICTSPNLTLFTNAEGEVNLNNLKEAKEITIKAMGYQKATFSYYQLSEMGFHLYLQHTNLNLEEVVFSATKWNQLSGTVPQKITAISPKEVAFQNPQTAADMLGQSGKVYIQKSQQGGGSPMIRGFATNRLLYTVDGVRMNTAIFRGGNIQNVINLDAFATEKTEVLFGPGSVIYGSDAIGGVMSFQTLTPQLAISEKDNPFIAGKAVMRYATANQEKTGHFDVNVGWKKWAFVTSFSAWNFDHLQQGANGPNEYVKPYYVETQNGIDVVVNQENELLQIPTAYSQQNLMQKVRFKPNQYWDFQYGLHYSETSPYGRYDRHNRTKNGLPRYAEWNYGPQTWMMNQLAMSYTKSNIFFDKASVKLALQNFNESRIERGFNQPYQITNKEKVDAYSLNVDWIKTHQKHVFYYGVEGVFNRVKSTGSAINVNTDSSFTAAPRYPKSNWASIGIYLSDGINLTTSTQLQVGLRVNQFLLNSTFDTTFYPLPYTNANTNTIGFSGNIGLVIKPTNQLTATINLSSGFRSPNVDDMGKFFDSEAGTVTVPNSDLAPEYAFNIDLGIAKVFGDFLKFDLTAYFTFLQDALVRRNTLFNGQDSIFYNGDLSQVQAIQNAAYAYVYGLQAGLEIKLPSGFYFSSDLNYQKGEEELDNGTKSLMRHAAPLFGISRLTYKSKLLQWQFYTAYQAELSNQNLAFEEQAKTEIYAKDNNGKNYAPAWITLNLKASYEINKNILITSGLENITNQRYRPYSSGISAAGRNFMLAVTAKF